MVQSPWSGGVVDWFVLASVTLGILWLLVGKVLSAEFF